MDGVNGCYRREERVDVLNYSFERIGQRGMASVDTVRKIWSKLE